MVKLVGEIYCKSRDYDLAISGSTQASHLVRRLITGVFKPSGYLQATFIGQAPRAHKSKNPKQIKPLNITAKNAIIGEWIITFCYVFNLDTFEMYYLYYL